MHQCILRNLRHADTRPLLQNPWGHSSAHSLRDVGNCDGAAFVTTAAECAVAAQSLDLLAVGAGPRPAQLTTNPFGCCENTPLRSPFALTWALSAFMILKRAATVTRLATPPIPPECAVRPTGALTSCESDFASRPSLRSPSRALRRPEVVDRGDFLQPQRRQIVRLACPSVDLPHCDRVPARPAHGRERGSLCRLRPGRAHRRLVLDVDQRHGVRSLRPVQERPGWRHRLCSRGRVAVPVRGCPMHPDLGHRLCRLRTALHLGRIYRRRRDPEQRHCLRVVQGGFASFPLLIIFRHRHRSVSSWSLGRCVLSDKFGVAARMRAVSHAV